VPVVVVHNFVTQIYDLYSSLASIDGCKALGVTLAFVCCVQRFVEKLRDLLSVCYHFMAFRPRICT
jgi:hypothetical protein